MNTKSTPKFTYRKNKLLQERSELIVDRFYQMYEQGYRVHFIHETIEKELNEKYGVTVPISIAVIELHKKLLKKHNVKSQKVA